MTKFMCAFRSRYTRTVRNNTEMEYWLDKLSQVETPQVLGGERRRAMAALILCNDFTHVQQLEHADSAEKWSGAEAHAT